MSTPTSTVTTFPNSSSIAAILYDSGKLLVEFRGPRRELGNVYCYSSVPESVGLAFAWAESPGKYFQAYVRDRFVGKRLW